MVQQIKRCQVRVGAHHARVLPASKRLKHDGRSARLRRQLLEERCRLFGRQDGELPSGAFCLRLNVGIAGTPAGSIYKMKGVVLSTEVPDTRVILQAVARRVDIAIEEPWGDRVPRTRVVAIGAKGAVEKETLEAIFT